jgi:PilZ domain
MNQAQGQNQDQASVSPHQKTSVAPYTVERRYRRFDLHFPVCLRFASRGTMREVEAVTRNVSVGGLLVKSSDRVPARTQVDLTLEVRGPICRRTVRLRSAGRVVRVEALGPGAGFAIAVECTRSIRRIEDHLMAAC